MVVNGYKVIIASSVDNDLNGAKRMLHDGVGIGLRLTLAISNGRLSSWVLFFQDLLFVGQLPAILFWGHATLNINRFTL